MRTTKTRVIRGHIKHRTLDTSMVMEILFCGCQFHSPQKLMQRLIFSFLLRRKGRNLRYMLTGACQGQDDCWNRYLRIDRSGALEYSDYTRVARKVTFQPNDTKEYPVFFYVQIIGTIWTCLYAAKSVLGSAGYSAGA